MANPTKQELLETVPATYDTERLRFEGLRGDVTRHLSREELIARLHALPPAPRDVGSVELLVARTETSGRILHESARLTVDVGGAGPSRGTSAEADSVDEERRAA